MRFGLQLYGFGKFCRSNPEQFFKLVSEKRYQFIEPCIWLFEITEDLKKYPIWTIEEFTTYKPLYEKYKLKVQSCHIFTNLHNLNTDSQISDLASKIDKLHSDFGITDFIIAGHSETTKEGCLSYAQKLLKLSNQTDPSIRLILHNGKEESIAKIDSKTSYEFILSSCEGKIKAQVHVGWLFYGGEDVESFLWSHKEIITSLHYKDFQKKSNGQLEETVIGNGLVDVESCFQFARANELPMIVDIDEYEEGSVDRIIGDVRMMFDGLAQARSNTRSVLCVYDIENHKVTKLRVFDRIIEAPNWKQTDNEEILFYNSEGHIYKYSISSDTEEVVNTGACTNCNNDHVLSPDGKSIAISHSDVGWQSKIYIADLDGHNEPILVTQNAPSFLHGWSPDGEELAYCAFREHEGSLCVDVYSISVKGGDEKRLTKDACFNDGPEYDPNGEHIWFNSTRTGLMQIWRMKRDGVGSDCGDFWAHPSIPTILMKSSGELKIGQYECLIL